MKKLRTISLTLLIAAIFFFSVEKEGYSQSLNSGKGDRFSLAYFRTLNPLQASETKQVHMKDLGSIERNVRAFGGKAIPKGKDSNKGKGYEILKEGHGLASPRGAGNDKYGISKGAEGLLPK